MEKYLYQRGAFRRRETAKRSECQERKERVSAGAGGLGLEILVEGTRGSFRWGLWLRGARQFQPECFCCFEVLAAFCKGRKICARFGTACRNSHWNIRETGRVSSSDRRHPVPAQLSRHLPSSGPSANAEHSWLEQPAPTGHNPQ